MSKARLGGAAEQLPHPRAGEGAERRRAQGFDRMLDGPLHRPLQADEVAREQEIRDLSAPVAQGLVAEGPALKQGEQLLGRDTLLQHGGARPCAQLADLDAGDDRDLVVARSAQRALSARHLLGEWRGRGHVAAFDPDAHYVKVKRQNSWSALKSSLHER